FFGEEKGLVGSRYYAGHPLVPLDKTVANINLEQTGRTDENGASGPVLKRMKITGQTFSDVPALLEHAASAEGVKLDQDDQKRSAQFFTQSDNLSFAEKGVPAH